VANWRISQLGLADGTVVASLADISGAGNTLAQATTGKQPTFKTAGINGVPALAFAGGQMLLTSAQLTLGNTWTIVTVADSTSTPAAAQQIVSSDDSSGVRAFQTRYEGSAASIGAIQFANDGTNRAVTTATLSPSAATASVLTFRRTFSVYGTKFEIWVNGVLAGSNYTAHNFGKSTLAPISMGARWSAGSIVDPLFGHIGDTILFDTWLNEAERRAAEAKVARVYGITLA
jgi:hypothetical protein